MATRFLNSLSSIIYVSQIFGIMPVLRRRRPPRARESEGTQQQQPKQSNKTTRRVGPSEAVTMTMLNPHDERVFGGDDANGIVNIRKEDMGDRDYVKSDKSFSVIGDGDAAEELHRHSGTMATCTDSDYMTQFNWKSPNSIFSMMIIALSLCEWLCTVRQLITHGANLGTIGAFNFYTIATFALVMLFGLARKWSRLYSFWASVSRMLDELPYQGTGINTGAKIRLVFCTWTIAATGT